VLATLCNFIRLYAEGTTKRGIATALNEARIPIRRAGKFRDGVKNSGTWSAAGVGFVLQNPIYIGVRAWIRHSRTGEKLPTSGKKRRVLNDRTEWQTVLGYGTPIIENQLWDVIQARLQQDREAFKHTSTARTGQAKLLSGFLKCGSCGGSFVIGAAPSFARSRRACSSATWRRGSAVFLTLWRRTP